MASATSSDLSKGILFRETFTVNSRDRDGKKLPTCNVNKEGCDGCKACKVPHFQQYVVVVRSRFPFSQLCISLLMSVYQGMAVYMCMHGIRYFISNSSSKKNVSPSLTALSPKKRSRSSFFSVSSINTNTHTHTHSKQSIEIRMHM